MNTPATDRPQPAAAEPTNADNTNPDAMTLDPMTHEPIRSALPDGHGEPTGHGEHGERPAGEALAVAMKPLLRGWLHLVLAPLCLIGCLVLALLADTTPARVGALVLGATATMLFGTSALYHRRYWSPRADTILRRLDHSNIYLIIAGTYTPFALTLLEGRQRVSLLVIVWVGALLGVAFRTFWVHAPRWLYTPIYVALGWVAIFYAGPLHAAGGTLVMTLIATGGILYTLGAVVYGFKRPDPWPRVFGFHEIFHACTVAAFIAHFIAAAIVLTR